MSRDPQHERGGEMLWAALDDFYSASKHKCNGTTATSNDVLLIAEKRISKQKDREKVIRCLLSIDVLSPALDLAVTHLSLGKPSVLVWGCVRYLFKVFNIVIFPLQLRSDYNHRLQKDT
jgi:hypothetical protein